MKRKILIDVLLNIIANILPMIALQFFILPQVALKTDPNTYGLLLTLMAFIYLSSSSFGSVLNNSRLIHHKSYEDLNLHGDYSIFLLIFICLNTLIMIVGLLFYGKTLDVLMNISLVLISDILLINTYASVEFRIKLNFFNILMSSFVLFIGYILGFMLFLFTGYWNLIYLFGFGFNFVYILIKTSIIQEKLLKTPLYNKTFSEVIFLLGAGILISLGAYADKLIIFPLLGGAAVAIYYTATILGKTIALAIGPITGVLLSYLAHMKKFSRNNFELLLLVSLIFGTISYFGIVLISEPLLTLIYPQYVAQTIQYIPVTTLSIIITIICSLINPILLKFSSAKWQLLINGVYMLVYISLSMLLLNKYGLTGFCIGILIANIIKLLIMIFTYYYINGSNYLESKRGALNG